MGFFGSLFTGNNPTLTSDIANSGQISNFGTNLGEKDLGIGSNFDQTLLSGNPEETAKLLAPQISTIQKQGQEQLNTSAEFGDRSGGTNASAQNNIDSQRAEVEKMIAQLTGHAADAITGIGENALGTGLNANKVQAQESDLKQKEQQNSLFGNVLGDLAGSAIGGLGTELSSVGSGNFGW